MIFESTATARGLPLMPVLRRNGGHAAAFEVDCCYFSRRAIGRLKAVFTQDVGLSCANESGLHVERIQLLVSLCSHRR